MKNIIIKSAAFLLLLIFYVSSFVILNSLEKKETTRPHAFTFSLPIPQDVCESFKVVAHPIVKEVYIAGLFSDWSSSNPQYKMNTFTDENNKQIWSLDLDLDPGSTEYKYVVYIEGRSDPVWVYDTSNPRKVPDGFEGFNSLYIQKYTQPLWTLIQKMLLYILIAYTLYLTLPLLYTSLLKKEVPLHSKSLLQVLLILLFCTAMTSLHLYRLRIMAQEQITETATVIKQMLFSDKNIESLSPMPHPVTLIDQLSAFIEETRLKTDSSSFSTKVSFTHIFFLDTDLKLLLHSGQESPDLELMAGNTAFPQWVRATLLKNFVRQSDNKAFRIEGPRFALPASEYYSSFQDQTSQQASLLGFQILLYPVKENSRLTGYMALLLHPGLYSRFFFQALLQDMIISVIFTMLFILTSSLGQHRSGSAGDQFYENYNITDREKDIISLIIKGANNQEIGKRLFISEKTVKSHVYNIYQKAGIQNRVELINKINEWDKE